MRALTYHGSNDVKVDTVPDPILQEQDDVILKITATATRASMLRFRIRAAGSSGKNRAAPLPKHRHRQPSWSRGGCG